MKKIKSYIGSVTIAISIAFSSNIQALDAPAVLQPAGLTPGDTFFVIFVTSTQFNYNRYANSAAIDTDGVNAAAAGALTSGVVGWRSLYGFEDQFGAGTHNTMDVAEAWGNVTDRPIYTSTGVLVANNRADMLDGTLIASIGFDEDGNVPANIHVYTGLTSAGNIAVAALGDGQGSGAQFGLNNSTTGTWAESALADVSRHLYVISPLLTTPSPAVASAVSQEWE